MFKSSAFQSYLWVLFTCAVAVAALLAHTCIVWVAIVGAFVFSMVVTRIFFKKWWNGEMIKEYPAWQRWTVAGLVAAIGSQMGWVALLI